MWRSSFRRLMQFYTVVLVVMVVGVTIIGSVFTLNNYRSQLRQAQNYAQQRLSSTLLRYQELTSDFATSIASNQQNLVNLDHYFTLSIPDYAEYTLERATAEGHYFNWPTEVNNFLAQHSEVQKLELALADQKQHYVAVNYSTTKQRSGRVTKQRQMDQHAFRAPLVDYQVPLESAGTVGLTFKASAFTEQLRQTGVRAHLQILVINDRGVVLGHYGDPTVSARERREVTAALHAGQLVGLSQRYITTHQALPSGYTMITAVNQTGQTNLLFWRILTVSAIGLAVLVLLSVTLWITFQRYERQLKGIVDTVQAVSGGDMAARVPANGQHADLANLARGINTMLGDIEHYITEIYKLQLAQQQANMKALQAQINPHFMSNTLEYIRMAALDADQPELAKVVFSFAALMRNNTDQSATTTLRQELAFLEKYIYLYQVRFPDRLAYQVQVDPDLAELTMPKFSLQPLVENYFKHGVDFARGDNAIAIKANRTAGGVRIAIKDNGKLIATSDLAHLNVQMTKPLGARQGDSIGLQNVYARMANYFGPSFKMRLQPNDVGGTTVMITFKERSEDDVARDGSGR